jgi:hypothetical protein
MPQAIEQRAKHGQEGKTGTLKELRVAAMQ